MVYELLQLFLGDPWFLVPLGLYCIACFGIHFLSIYEPIVLIMVAWLGIEILGIPNVVQSGSFLQKSKIFHFFFLSQQCTFVCDYPSFVGVGYFWFSYCFLEFELENPCWSKLVLLSNIFQQMLIVWFTASSSLHHLSHGTLNI